MQHVLVIHAHPVEDTFSELLREAYIQGAQEAAAEVRLLDLRQMKFNLNFKQGYRGQTDMEADLIKAQEWILWANHLVFFYPNWWATYPALLKGFIDRVFLPGFAFTYEKGKRIPDRLLSGKSARLVVTMDDPVWYYKWLMKAPGHHAMKKGLLNFVGISPVRITSIGSVRRVSDKRRSKYLDQIKKLGRKII